MKYRVPQMIVVTVDGVDHHLDPAREYDDENPEDAAVIVACRGHFSTPTVEAATAAPGERRNARRG